MRTESLERPKACGTAPKAYMQRSASGLIDSRHAGARPLSQSTTAFRLAKLCAMARLVMSVMSVAQTWLGLTIVSLLSIYA